jgi:hypothetical protein
VGRRSPCIIDDGDFCRNKAEIEAVCEREKGECNNQQWHCIHRDSINLHAFQTLIWQKSFRIKLPFEKQLFHTETDSGIINVLCSLCWPARRVSSFGG